MNYPYVRRSGLGFGVQEWRAERSEGRTRANRPPTEAVEEMDAAQDSGEDSDLPPPPMWSNVTSLAKAPSAAGSSSGSGARASCEHVSQKVRLGKDAGAAGGSNPGRGSASAPSPSRSGTGLGRVPSNFGRSTRASSGSSTDSLGTGSKLRRAAGTVQRHWRGLRGRWKVMKRLTWLVSSGLDQMDEQLILDLGIFLEVPATPTPTPTPRADPPYPTPPLPASPQGLASGEGSSSLIELSHEAGEDNEAGGQSALSGGGGNQAQACPSPPTQTLHPNLRLTNPFAARRSRSFGWTTS